MNNRFSKGYLEDAGTDIILDKDILLSPGLNVIDLNVSVVIKEGTCGIIAPRSSAAKKGIFIANCPIDANYSGNVHAMVFNLTTEPIKYTIGTSFCQIIILQISQPDFQYNVKKSGKRSLSNFGGTDNANNS